MSTSIQASFRRILRLWAAAAIAALVGAWPSMAGAQTVIATSETQNNLQEIVVTAQYRKQNLQDTPIAITAVTGAMMEARGQVTLQDIAQQAPNVQLVATGGAFGNGMTAYIRGIGQADFDPAFAPGVGIYIDDVYYTSLTGSNFALLDLDRVEIQRGPQGTLSGANSEGGAIKLYSVVPKGDDSGFVKVSYGQRNLLEVQGMADISLVSDYLFLRVSGVAHQQDGYLTRYDYGCLFPASGVPANGGYTQGCVAGHEGGTDYHGARAALRWLASDTFEVNLIGDVTIDNSQVAAETLLGVNPAVGWTAGEMNSGLQAPPPPGTPPGTPLPPPAINPNLFIPTNAHTSYANFCAGGITGNTYCWTPYTYTKVWGTNLTMDWKIADSLALKSITAYREFHSEFTNDDDASPVGASLGWSELLNHTFTQELRLSGAVGKVIDYTVGGFFLDQVTTYPTHQVLDYIFAPTAGVPGSGSFDFLGDDPIAERDYAGFANATWHIVDGLDLSGGLRYTHQEKTYTYNRYNPPTVLPGSPFYVPGGGSFFFPPGFSGTQGTFSGGKTDYRVALNYNWTPELMTYLSVSTGFKGGGTNPRPFEASQIVPFGPETLTAYEVGFKSDWFDHTLRVNVAAFYNDYKNIQVVLLSCPQFSGGNAAEPCAAPVNGGDANIYGVEFEGGYRYGGLSIDASASWQHFEYTYVVPASGIPPDSTEPGFQPKKWSLGAQYDAHLPILDRSFRGSTGTIRADTSPMPTTIRTAGCRVITCSMAASPTNRSRIAGRPRWSVRT